MKKVYSYQLFFNLYRPNTYKEGKTPWELAKAKMPNLDRRLLMIPPIDLDTMVRLGMPFCAKGDNYLLTVPFFLTFFHLVALRLKNGFATHKPLQRRELNFQRAEKPLELAKLRDNKRDN